MEAWPPPKKWRSPNPLTTVLLLRPKILESDMLLIRELSKARNMENRALVRAYHWTLLVIMSFLYLGTKLKIYMKRL